VAVEGWKSMEQVIHHLTKSAASGASRVKGGGAAGAVGAVAVTGATVWLALLDADFVSSSWVKNAPTLMMRKPANTSPSRILSAKIRLIVA
jgi:hypothetical protein